MLILPEVDAGKSMSKGVCGRGYKLLTALGSRNVTLGTTAAAEELAATEGPVAGADDEPAAEGPAGAEDEPAAEEPAAASIQLVAGCEAAAITNRIRRWYPVRSLTWVA